MLSTDPSTPHVLWSMFPVLAQIQFCSGLADGGWLAEGVEEVMIIRSFHPLGEGFFSEEEATRTLIRLSVGLHPGTVPSAHSGTAPARVLNH